MDGNNNKSSPSTDKLFLAWADVGVSAPLVAVLGAKALLGLLALGWSASLLWLTAFSRSLHSNCNLLIALNAMNTAIFCLGPLPPFLVVLSGRNFISLGHCFPLQAIPLASFHAQIFLCLAIGLDRLFSVLLPIFYRSLCWRRPYYVLMVTLLCYFYSAQAIYSALLQVLDNPNRPVMCSTTDIGVASDERWLRAVFLLNLVTPLCYVLLGLVLRFRIGQNQQQQVLTRKIFKAVFAMMLLQLLGWLLNQCLQVFLRNCQLDAVSVWFVRNVGAFPLYLALAMDAPALYLLSQDYQKAFVQHFPPVARLFCRCGGVASAANSLDIARTNVQLQQQHNSSSNLCVPHHRQQNT